MDMQIPSEIFPTRYRCTCHGISAASGKLASVFVQATLPHMSFGLDATDLNSNGMGWVLIIFSGALLLGSFFAWAWIPEVQSGHRVGHGWTLPNKSLEELAGGMKKAEAGGQVIGMRRRIKWLVNRR
jgi:PHS family inorganic phosphate transporter-like MFS transporter